MRKTKNTNKTCNIMEVTLLKKSKEHSTKKSLPFVSARKNRPQNSNQRKDINVVKKKANGPLNA